MEAIVGWPGWEVKARLEAPHGPPLPAGTTACARVSKGCGTGRNIGDAPTFPLRTDKEFQMLRGVLLWLIGIPIPIIILLWLFLD